MAIGGSGATFIIYTTQEGGDYHCGRCTRDQYEMIRENQEITVTLGPEMKVITEPVYIAFLAVVEDNFDYIIGDVREDEAA